MRIAYFKAMLLIAAGRVILLLPDAALAKLVAMAGFFVALAAPSSEINEMLGEVRVIFEKGGEGAQIARNMLGVGSRRRIRMLARSVFL
jgi:hypothetical protein